MLGRYGLGQDDFPVPTENIAEILQRRIKGDIVGVIEVNMSDSWLWKNGFDTPEEWEKAVIARTQEELDKLKREIEAQPLPGDAGPAPGWTPTVQKAGMSPVTMGIIALTVVGGLFIIPGLFRR